MFDPKTHWEKIYSEKKPTEVSWYQQNPERSLKLILENCPYKDARIIDVGGGASLLEDCLLEQGFTNVSVLDISENALELSKQRLGTQAGKVNWIVENVTLFSPRGKYDLWHDRAVFHFLIEKADRDKYVACASRAIVKGGVLILAAFSKDGPNMCSNLNVRQYDAELVREEFGTDFEWVKEEEETHQTPWGKDQKFRYFVLRKK
jgi:2-polyprenyl-3-methyl-5-hydroxy-6-metoxy-1,4-benzoquinol methylase